MTDKQETDARVEWSITGLPLPVFIRPAQPMTDEELLRFSSENEGYRIEKTSEGDLYIMTPLGGYSSRWEAFVIRELSQWAEEHGGEAFSSNGGFNLNDGSMLSPDASWVSSERWNGLTDAQRASFPPLCPDFVIEILSGSDSRRVLQTKMDVWMANGARLAWMIDPRACTVLIYRPGEQPEALQQPDEIVADDPVRGFRLRTSSRWKTGTPS